MAWPVRYGHLWLLIGNEARDTHLPVMNPRPIVPAKEKSTFLQMVITVECVVEIDSFGPLTTFRE